MNRNISIFIVLVILFTQHGTAFASSIVINEFLPNPAGSSAEEGEWIELFNASDQEMSLAGWQLDDDENGSIPYALPGQIRIPAYGFFIFEKSESKISLNNTHDAVRLLDGSGNLIDAFIYEETVEEYSYGRVSDGASEWRSFSTPTKNASNAAGVLFITPTPTNAPEPTPTKTPIPTKTPSPTEIIVVVHTVAPSDKPTIFPLQKTGSSSAGRKQHAAVLAIRVTGEAPSPFSTQRNVPKVLAEKKSSNSIWFFVVAGVLFIGCAILAFNTRRRL